ncbi:MAG: hypothetical protein Q9M36_04545 [Sulfurovum sp.]|nr:hypothetical protein [Sulfurovum sp.]
MSGLVALKYLVDEINQRNKLKISKLLLYDVPIKGSHLVKLASFYDHSQIKQLDKSSDFLDALVGTYEFKNIEDKLKIKCLICQNDIVVDRDSAKAHFEEVDELDKTHGSIVKPINDNDISYLAFRDFILDENIIEGLFEKLSKPNAVPQMVITENGINRLQYINDIKLKAREYYQRSNTYHIALPKESMSRKSYFHTMAKQIASDKESENELREDMIRLVEGSRDKIFSNPHNNPTNP